MHPGIKQNRLHRVIGVKKGYGGHQIGIKSIMAGNKLTDHPSVKESHNIYDHHSNSNFIQRLPMLHTGQQEHRSSGLSHIEKNRKINHLEHFS